MKAPAFDYVRPRSLDEVFALRATHGDESRLLAGGQTLLATLNIRLSHPSLLIDLAALDVLRGIAVHGDMLRIGALTTHREIAESPLVATHAPLLAMAAPHIAHPAIRNLGTWGGSIAFADPAAEWPSCLLALDGVVIARSTRGERRIAAQDFFVSLYTTALAEDELIAACEVPVARADTCHDFDELARRRGDYAIAGLAFVARRSGSGLSDVRLAFVSGSAAPLRARRAELALTGTPDASRLDDAVAALASDLDPPADVTHSAETRRHLAGVLLRRAVARVMRAST